MTVAAEAIKPCISSKERKVKKTKSVSESEPQFTKPKQLYSSECLALEMLRYVLQNQFGSRIFCLTQLDISCKDIPVNKEQRRFVPMKIVKIVGVFSPPFDDKAQNGRFVAHVHIEKGDSNVASRLSSFSLSTDGLDERDAHRMWIIRKDDPMDHFSQRLIRGMRRPVAKERLTKSLAS